MCGSFHLKIKFVGKQCRSFDPTQKLLNACLETCYLCLHVDIWRRRRSYTGLLQTYARQVLKDAYPNILSKLLQLSIKFVPKINSTFFSNMKQNMSKFI